MMPLLSISNFFKILFWNGLINIFSYPQVTLKVNIKWDIRDNTIILAFKNYLVWII